MILRLIYTTIFTLALPIILVRLWWRGRKLSSYRGRIGERFAVIPKPHYKHHQTIWFHTVSVGEFIAASQLIQRILDTQQFNIIVTTTTPTGSEQVSKTFGDKVYHVYAPYDLPFLLKRFLRTLQPDLAVFMETELWPNTLRACKNAGIPTLLANGRLSEKSAKGYKKFSSLTQPMLQDLTFAAIQNATDAERFIQLGLQQEKTAVTGSIKFDVCISDALKQTAHALQLQYNLNHSRSVFIAASTHKGEDEIILEAYKLALKTHPNLLLVLVPRHPDRFSSIYDMCKNQGFQVIKRSSSQAPTEDTQIILGDTMGELMLLFGTADIAFIGGSFIPNGGHNYIEPALWQLPILSGPSQFNFASVAQALSDANSLFTVDSAHALAEQLTVLLSQPELRITAGKAGKAVVAQNQGATDKHLNHIFKFLPKR